MNFNFWRFFYETQLSSIYILVLHHTRLFLEPQDNCLSACSFYVICFTLSDCQAGEFMCYTYGEKNCLPIGVKCNIVVDCDNATDEIGCDGRISVRVISNTFFRDAECSSSFKIYLAKRAVWNSWFNLAKKLNLCLWEDKSLKNDSTILSSSFFHS